MFLRQLTIKGFKSFADPVSLDLAPGVTVVVGPNGSGKSNVVDAIAWVLGAQAPSAVRSQKMDDVIFAGTATRSPLGRAEVSLTIDNSAGILPIEFSEVTVRRTLFRSGESEYAINEVPCRLLDVQELLSDAGVGRQQHVIVSQGQIDAVLNARPEERRAIIEEAAGGLKYRKRKGKAERRLDATEANLLRVQDLLREVRRQLRPLERQAALGLLLALAVLEDPGRLFDDRPALLGAGVEHRVDLTLADDHVLLAADTGVGQQILDVEQAARHLVDGVLALAAAEQGAAHRHLAELDGQDPGRVVDRQADLGPAERRAGGRAGEDDVVHLLAADRAGRLRSEDPGNGVDDVGLAGPVRADDHGDARFELHRRALGERLEALEGEALQEHGGSEPTGSPRSGQGSRDQHKPEDGESPAVDPLEAIGP